jgi:hypothetical protein
MSTGALWKDHDGLGHGGRPLAGGGEAIRPITCPSISSLARRLPDRGSTQTKHTRLQAHQLCRAVFSRAELSFFLIRYGVRYSARQYPCSGVQY